MFWTRYLSRALQSRARYYATTLKIAGWVSYEAIQIFNWSNPSIRTIALRSTQTLQQKWIPWIFLMVVADA
jgi:hypothetical protein